MIRAIIFDFDGVLADSYSQVYALNREAMSSLGLHLSENEFKKCLVQNIHRGFRILIGSNKSYQKFVDFKKRHFNDFFASIDLFSGVPDFLRKIEEKYILTIASANREEVIMKLLKKYGLDDIFDFILSSRELTKEKMLKKILSGIGSKPQETIMVSDTHGDIVEAKKINLRTIGVTWGFHSFSLLNRAEPDFIARNFNELNLIL